MTVYKKVDYQPKGRFTFMKKKKWILRILAAICVTAIVVSGVRLYQIYSNYNKSNHLYDDLSKKVTKTKAKSDQKSSEWYELCTVDFSQLQATNKEAIAWLYVENNETISYPIMYSGDNDKYLRTALDGSSAIAGSIFLEGDNTADFTDLHTLIYGHNMRNRSMFGSLREYKNDPDYYKDHQYFQVITPTKAYRYQIFAYSVVDPNADVYTVYKGDLGDEKYGTFLESLKKGSLRDTGVDVTANDRVVTLSTCTGQDDRFVVHGKLIATHDM